jgi:hypothetical protein
MIERLYSDSVTALENSVIDEEIKELLKFMATAATKREK